MKRVPVHVSGLTAILCRDPEVIVLFESGDPRGYQELEQLIAQMFPGVVPRNYFWSDWAELYDADYSAVVSTEVDFVVSTEDIVFTEKRKGNERQGELIYVTATYVHPELGSLVAEKMFTVSRETASFDFENKSTGFAMGVVISKGDAPQWSATDFPKDDVSLWNPTEDNRVFEPFRPTVGPGHPVRYAAELRDWRHRWKVAAGWVR